MARRVVSCGLAGLAACASATLVLAAPGPRASIPRDPAALSRKLVDTKTELGRAIDAWRAGGDPLPSREVTLDALYDQRIELLLAGRPGLARTTLRLVPAAIADGVRSNLAAKRELWRLTPPTHRRRFRTGPALPPATLLRYYREAQHRFGVRWNVLAAVNFVESAFNKLRNNSATGAQGPMQFMPATWRAYGLGGDIRDPHDAILGAANYLHANEAPRDNRRALFRYNPSALYVDAVLRYARQIRSDRHAFYEFYARQVFVRTPSGLRRITGP
ncbi:MAG: lytic transglycosylase domain-containing protein [Actinobacteria bacterium]|nr:MAG: lytic transglycosylase domain-containing protein [Actinomycetota bacterium]